MDIYQYDDFRRFLADLHAERKAAEPGLTARRFAALAGWSNPGYFGDVVKGRRKLSAAAVEKMVQVFAMKPNEAEFFRLLVRFGQARKAEDRQEGWRQMLFRRNRSAFTRLNPSLSRYYQDYRYPLVRAAIEVLDFRGDYDVLARFLHPPLPVHQVQKCVRELCEWGLVRQGRDGRYRVTDRFVEPSPTMGEAIRQLNRTWIAHGMEALARFSPSERHVSTIILNVSDKACREIRERVERFREEIFEIAKSDECPERVMQLSLQFFPKSRLKEST